MYLPEREHALGWGRNLGLAGHLRQTSLMPFDVTALGNQVLIDPDEGEHRLGDRWADQTQVILFLRHFG